LRKCLPSKVILTEPLLIYLKRGRAGPWGFNSVKGFHGFRWNPDRIPDWFKGVLVKYPLPFDIVLIYVILENFAGCVGFEGSGGNRPRQRSLKIERPFVSGPTAGLVNFPGIGFITCIKNLAAGVFSVDGIL
jgi:hypothetical protein